ncbi:MAG: ADP-dependent NAD(P)H-hydrate dehydratase [Microcella sp.]
MSDEQEVTPAEAAALVRVPTPDDDKYARGVLGLLTGSSRYPGAAVLGVEAALRTGVGMVRYLGPGRAADLVLQRRPEAVTAPGRVQAWVVGSGMPLLGADATGAAGDPLDSATAEHVRAALASGHPVIIDAGAITPTVLSAATGPVIITPHAGELARLTGADIAAVRSEPGAAGRAAAERFGVAVLLKGHTTRVVAPGAPVLVARQAPAWLATAGAGDALAGILGALTATHAAATPLDTVPLDTAPVDLAYLARLGAAAAVLHGLAATRASAGGPLTVLDLCAALPATIAALLDASAR